MNAKSNLLLVDDHTELLEFIADDLNEDYQITTSSNGREALDVLATEYFDLIVSDVMMPEMDGFELCQKIKEDIAYAHIPVILLTAKNSIESKIQGLEYGADAYIEKPFSPAFLRAQIASLLKNRVKVKEFFIKNPMSQIQQIGQNQSEQEFLLKIEEIIMQHLDDPQFNVDRMADILCMSRPTLYRKINVVSSLSPNELINLTRLRKAAELLIQKQHKVYEISNLLGYSSATHFSRNFQKQFGQSPTEFQDAQTALSKS
ncbi:MULTISPECIES: response regulator transcription factor [Sphingobacterium]|jgi:CheY-like chemotaxis protein/AraC-like DNA-binding protein|uniref:Response regulator ArlR n=1 Tax=Sphingobacterium multivorum TaxID=28454 RepID=A0A2X2LTM7_SPHMU|nr:MULTISPECIES: response regulator [Sphingobacterium]QRQ62521.1 response regulator [Sphingobacterium multivorum]SPZ92880.1 Response regulator ArlR [Sphingobacterium multivorum]HAU53090.1 two-component system response regulator [Sphingobacterium sp.]